MPVSQTENMLLSFYTLAVVTNNNNNTNNDNATPMQGVVMRALTIQGINVVSFL